MRKSRIARVVPKALSYLGFAGRLLYYDMFVGERDGLVIISHGVTSSGRATIQLGKRVFLGRYGVFQGNGMISVGARTYIGNFFDFNSRSKIDIADDCMFGNFVTLVDNNHGTALDEDMRVQAFNTAPIVIERNCWLGEKVTVLAGVTIHANAIIGAGSVVTRDVPANSVVAGVPARVLRIRAQDGP